MVRFPRLRTQSQCAENAPLLRAKTREAAVPLVRTKTFSVGAYVAYFPAQNAISAHDSAVAQKSRTCRRKRENMETIPRRRRSRVPVCVTRKVWKLFRWRADFAHFRRKAQPPKTIPRRRRIRALIGKKAQNQNTIPWRRRSRVFVGEKAKSDNDSSDGETSRTFR